MLINSKTANCDKQTAGHEWCGQISLSLMCNLRHSFCFQRSFSSDRLADEILFEKLRPLYERINTLRILGGEPTIIPGSYAYIEWLMNSYRHINLEIVTNGLALNDAWLAMIAKHRIGIQVSVNGISNSVFAKIMRIGNPIDLRNRIYNNLNRLIALDKTLSEPIINNISMVVNQDTCEDLLPFVDYALSNGINMRLQIPSDMDNQLLSAPLCELSASAVKLQHFCSDYISLELKGVPDSVFDKVYEERQTLAQEKSLFLKERFDSINRSRNTVRNYHYCARHKTTDICMMPSLGFSIASDGFVFPCCHLSNYPIGNLYIDSIDDILFGERRGRLQEMLDGGNYVFCWDRCEHNHNPSSSKAGSASKFTFPHEALFRAGDYAKSLEEIEKIEMSSLYTATVCYQHAFCLHCLGFSEKAVAYYTKALDKGFSEFWIRYNRGSLLLDLGRRNDAAMDINRALELDPDHAGIKQIKERFEGLAS